MRPRCLAGALLAAALLSVPGAGAFAEDAQPSPDALLVDIDTTAVSPGAEQFTVPVTYESYDPDDQSAAPLPRSLKVNGDWYQLERTARIQRTGSRPRSPREKAWTGKAFTRAEDEDTPPEQLEEDGVTYTLQSSALNTVDGEARSVHREQSVTYSGVEERAEIPDTLDDAFDDPVTGEPVTATLPLAGQTESGGRWDGSFTCTAVAQNYTADHFYIGSELVPAGSLAESGGKILALLSLDTAYYRIREVEFTGDPYDENGVMCRDILCRGEKYVRDVTAVYAGDVSLAPIREQQWTAEYLEDVPEAERTVYEYSAEAAYRREETAAERIEGNPVRRAAGKAQRIALAGEEAAARWIREHMAVSGAAGIALLILSAAAGVRRAKNRCVYHPEMRCIRKRHNAEICASCPYYMNRNEIKV